MRWVEAIDQYEAMDQQEAFDIEYWPLEEAKLKRMPPEQELARQIHVVIGAGAGIGREAALRLAKEGVRSSAWMSNDQAAEGRLPMRSLRSTGQGIGVAGNGNFQLRSGDRSWLRHD